MWREGEECLRIDSFWIFGRGMRLERLGLEGFGAVGLR